MNFKHQRNHNKSQQKSQRIIAPIYPWEKKLKIFHALTLFASILAFQNNAYAAKISLFGSDPNLVAVRFTGEIRPNDYDTLRRLIEPRLSANNSFRWFYLDSIGGDVATAMKIGRYIRMLQFDTQIDANARCLSSCVFIFSAGLQRTATTNNIGIHRPYGTSVGSFSRDDVAKNYREMTTQIYSYFNEMNIPRSLPELMLRIPPEQMMMLEPDQSIQLGLIGKDPIEQEKDDAANAASYGISRVEYLARRNRALNTCNSSSADFVNCYEAILKGRR